MKKLCCENEKSVRKASTLRTVKQKDAKTLGPGGTIAPWQPWSAHPWLLQETKNPCLFNLH